MRSRDDEVVLETGEIENQEKQEVAQMSVYCIPIDAEFNADSKNAFLRLIF